MIQFLTTVFIGAITGLLFYKLKIPGGMMVGALVGSVLLNLTTDAAYMPYTARLMAQITAGAFVGASVQRSDIQRLPKLAKPACILVGGMLVLNIVMGIVIHHVSGLDWMTSFFCAVPGGMSDTPILAAEMGANGAAVALMQFSRLVCGIGIFPSIIAWMTRNEPQSGQISQVKAKKEKSTMIDLLATLCVAGGCGIVGKLSGIPVGALTFSMIGTAIFKLACGHAVIPLWLKRLAQVLSGTYIGCSIGLQELLDLRTLLLPALLLVSGYLLNCILLSALLHKSCGLSRRIAMLSATPAGANDMALISGDLGVVSPDLNVLQIVRMITAVSLFPQVICLLASCLE